MLLLQKANFSDRENLGNFLNECNLTGEGVEIGTHRGDFSEQILEKWKGKKLYCVDPWQDLPDYKAKENNLGEGTREDHFIEAKRKLLKFGDKCKIVRNVSEYAVNNFKARSLDFVYLDGNHSYLAVKNELYHWWSKIKKGGIISGHDIICPGELNGGWGKEIQKAVFEFADWINLPVYLIVETQFLPWSFYIVKE